jgi:hypothetical protein
MPFTNLRVTDGRFSFTAPITPPSTGYKISASAHGYRGSAKQFEFELGGPSRATRPPVPSPGSRSFSGNGTKNLGDLSVNAESILTWTNDGGAFSVVSGDGGIAVSSQARRGTSVVPAGHYPNVQVIAFGNWTIKIRPR